MYTSNYFIKNRLALISFLIYLFVSSNIYGQLEASQAPNLTSYEEPENTDMVNLNTGDFTYNIPIMSVPSPDGGSFPINIFYHAGIKPNQIASQVGLGWGLNPGCINRFKVGYPDDFCYEYSPYESYGYPLSPIKTAFIKSHEYDKGFTTTSAMLNLGFLCPELDLSLTYNTNSNSSKGGELGINSIFSGSNLPSFLTGKSEIPSMEGMNSKWKSEVIGGFSIPGLFNKTKIRYTLDYREEKVPFGALYLNQFFTEWEGVGIKVRGDMDIFNDINTYNDIAKIGLTHIAYDNYVVNAPLISGVIRPIVFENGTLVSSMEEYVYADLNKFNRIDYKSINTITKPSNVRFRYEDEAAGNVKMQSGYIYLKDPLNDPDIIKNPKIASVTTNFFSPPLENEANGFKNNYLVGQKFVEWFVYNELVGNGKSSYSANLPVNVGALDRKDQIGYNYNHEDNFRRTRIHAFKITNEQGFSYHFGIPVWARDEKMKVFKGFNDDGTDNFDENKSYVEISQLSEYAYSWLLTAITGPDYVDANENGITDEQDYGYWVKFEYGKLTDNYTWRSPKKKYLNDIPGRDAKNVLYKGNKYYITASKQLYYLDKIKTRSHSAIFLYSERDDILSTNNIKQLKNDQIILFQNDDLNLLEKNYTIKSGNFYLTNLYKTLSSEAIDRIAEKTVKKINFSFTYDLCKDVDLQGKLTLNSISSIGANNVIEQPPHLFSYNKNPPYYQNAYDRWGYYKNDSFLPGKYVTPTSKIDVDAWSLNSITTPQGANLKIIYESDDYSKITTSDYITEKTKYGGGLRVKEISTSLLGETFSNVYKYNADDNIHSSGVVPNEPESYDLNNVPLNMFNDAPPASPNKAFEISVSGVLYQKVRIEKHGNGKLESYSDYYFEPFDISKHLWRRTQYDSDHTHGDQKYSYRIKTHNLQQCVGRLLKVNIYNSFNHLISTKELIYKDFSSIDFQNAPGVRTEVSHTAKKFMVRSILGMSSVGFYLSVNEQIIYPSVLQEIKETTNNLTNSVVYTYDSNTGLITSKTIKRSNDDKKELILYAHNVYPEMSSKVFNINNKNLLTPISARLYLLKNSDNWYIYDAAINTYKSEWNYRAFSPSDQKFLDFSYMNYIPVYRPHKTFLWRGNLNSFGAFNSTSFDYYYNTLEKLQANWSDFKGDGINGWEKTHEIGLYNNFSNILEAKNIYNKIYSAKFDNYGNNIISANNSNSKEIAFCSAEDGLIDNTYFSSEVLFKNGSSYINNSIAHSGKNSIRLDYNGPTLQYNQICGSYGIKTDRRYQIALWVYETNATSLNFKYQYLKGNSIIDSKNIAIIPTQCFKADKWLLFTYELPVSSENSALTDVDYLKIEISNGTNNSIPCYIDDFSLKPVDNNCTKSIFDYRTYNLLASIDNENITTKLEYNDINELIGTYKETTSGIRLVSRTKNSYYRNKYEFTITPKDPVEGESVILESLMGPTLKCQWQYGVIKPSVPSYNYDKITCSLTRNCSSITLKILEKDGKVATTSRPVNVKYFDISSSGSVFARGNTIIFLINSNLNWNLSNIKVEYYRQSSQGSIQMVNLSLVSNNSISWSIPSDFTQATDYCIRVTYIPRNIIKEIGPLTIY